jgi:hypothetical protein
MNDDNKTAVRAAINEAAIHLDGKLPDSPMHPAGRNPHAHVAAVLKNLLGHSYTECEDNDTQTILDIIRATRNHPF